MCDTIVFYLSWKLHCADSGADVQKENEKKEACSREEAQNKPAARAAPPFVSRFKMLLAMLNEENNTYTCLVTTR